MTKYLVEQTETKTATYEVEAETPEEALERFADSGTPIHSELQRSKPWIAGTQE
ncbi:hypothetical protein SEA_PATIO_75 [Gordonia phage Patio]|uniref:Uncharacterized protein n=3 Tax=Skysandvirus TaxID=2948912 RepID=A0A2D2W4P0_9CAUD|nr:hypothetical protein KNT76_gp75 [Gordonia phage Patio]YP_010098145.1 hypothetical protein KNU08_gp77 [Gordonia phage Skysand]YP_010103184.1 hypothetical protein KNU64_gp77 [Gordonia Phage Lollipop1437]QRI45315.1 hypothetical protein SEA_ENNEA_81 [Gordonia phage Ennea]QXN74459.1 hypothetical protein SEA_FLOAT294_76 [Gordonia phage Float294]ATS93156.1 hypothetical protein SEA_PATIO_75 [Gordonia phage Patio]AXQ62110.1 hypothetical protein SEA_SKYSAND_77 [Gordonia phage Skysand]QDF19181.1 hyp